MLADIFDPLLEFQSAMVIVLFNGFLKSVFMALKTGDIPISLLNFDAGSKPIVHFSTHISLVKSVKKMSAGEVRNVSSGDIQMVTFSERRVSF